MAKCDAPTPQRKRTFNQRTGIGSHHVKITAPQVNVALLGKISAESGNRKTPDAPLELVLSFFSGLTAPAIFDRSVKHAPEQRHLVI